VRVGVSLGDSLASLYGTIGALLALHHIHANKGEGQYIDVALYEAVFGIMESLIPEYAALGHVRERTGASLPGISPSNTYICRDGRYVIIAGNGDSIFRRLMVAIGRQDLADDPELARNDGRVKHNSRLDAAITAWTSQHDLDDVLRVLDAADVPSGRIYTAADIHADPHYAARDMIGRFELPDGEPIELPGIVPKLSATPGQTRWLGPALGEHTAEVLAGLGIDATELAALKADGVGPDRRRSAEETGRPRPRGSRLLGQRLQAVHRQPPDEEAGRPEGHEDPHPVVEGPRGADAHARRDAAGDGVLRAVYRAADRASSTATSSRRRTSGRRSSTKSRST